MVLLSLWFNLKLLKIITSIPTEVEQIYLEKFKKKSVDSNILQSC